MKFISLFSQCPPAGIVRIDSIWRHPNADTLDVAYVHGTMPCIVKRGTFDEGDLAVYIPAGSLVYTDQEAFKFLRNDARGEKKHCVRAIRIRGFLSMGLLVEVPLEMKGIVVEGQDVSAYMQVQKAVPETITRDTREILAENEIKARFIFVSSLVLLGVMLFLLFIFITTFTSVMK